MKSENINIRATKEVSEYYHKNNVENSGSLSSLIIDSFPDLFYLTIHGILFGWYDLTSSEIKKLDQLKGFPIKCQLFDRDPLFVKIKEVFNADRIPIFLSFSNFEWFCLQIWINSTEECRDRLKSPETKNDKFYITSGLLKSMLEKDGLKMPHRSNIFLWKKSNKLENGTHYQDRNYSKEGYERIKFLIENKRRHIKKETN